MSLITLGSDMECFAQTPDGKHKAICGLIGGTKEEPMPIKALGKGYFIQEDNVAVEYNIPVCSRRSEFVVAFSTMREYIKQTLASLNLVMSTNASVSFDKKELTHPQALVFGCEPDYNAWSVKENRKPTAKDKCLRTAGGHIHVGTQVDMLKAVRAMDLWLGVPSVLIDDSPASVARRELYGKAGAMRPKPYGFEYRVLSNFWMFEDYLVSWVFNNTAAAMQMNFDMLEPDSELIQKCINEGDKELAQTLIKKYGIPLPVASKPVIVPTYDQIPF